jgi:hypothetical protein
VANPVGLTGKKARLMPTEFAKGLYPPAVVVNTPDYSQRPVGFNRDNPQGMGENPPEAIPKDLPMGVPSQG